MSDTATTTRPELSPEEKAKRARVAEIRAQIRKEAGERRVVKAAYRLPHGGAEYLAALATARKALGIDEKYIGPWNAHAIPGRDYGRADVTALHIELANLRGKVHLTPKKTPA